jgi:hypothetical protein
MQIVRIKDIQVVCGSQRYLTFMLSSFQFFSGAGFELFKIVGS